LKVGLPSEFSIGNINRGAVAGYAIKILVASPYALGASPYAALAIRRFAG